MGRHTSLHTRTVRPIRTDFETGMSNSETVVALSGLDESSRIITTWHPDLKDGAKVQLAEGQADPEAGAAPARPPRTSPRKPPMKARRTPPNRNPPQGRPYRRINR